MTVPIAMLICVTPPAMTPGMPSATSFCMSGVQRGRRSFKRQAVAAQAPHQQRQLQEAGNEHAPGLNDAGRRIGLDSPATAESSVAIVSTTIEHDGDGRALGELADRVEHAGHQGHERHAQQVGQRDARQQHGEIELLRVFASKPGAEPYMSHGIADLGDDR